MIFFRQITTFGSPPRVWGIRKGKSAVRIKVRFTPTCVGNTLPLLDGISAHPVHPHVCGEYGNFRLCHRAIIGSPPRVWGIRWHRRRRHHRFRFTPTCVGNTFDCPHPTRDAPVHPHVCGEYGYSSFRFISVSGSPPRVWGIPLQQKPIMPPIRFTPTCVGNTVRRPFSSSSAPVHPHVCGEYLAEMDMSGPVTVHPHVCGEYSTRFRMWLAGGGSPPRVWGILECTTRTIRPSRFTPTCVGNTLSQFTNES